MISSKEFWQSQKIEKQYKEILSQINDLIGADKLSTPFQIQSITIQSLETSAFEEARDYFKNRGYGLIRFQGSDDILVSRPSF